MNFFAWCGLATFISSTSFGIFTILNVKKSIHKIWATFNFLVALWGFCAFKFSTSPNPEGAFFWLYVGHIGVTLIPVLYIHFVLELLQLKKPKTLFIIYFIGFTFFIVNLLDFTGITKLFITHVTFVFNQFYVDRPAGPIYPYFVAFFFIMVGYAHVLAVHEVTKAQGLKRVQINYFLWAMAPAFSGGGTSFIMVFGIDLYPFLHFTVPFYPVIMTYAIVRHQFLDIEIIIRKTLVFAGLFAMIMLVVTGVTTVMQDLIGRFIAVPPMIATALSVSLAISLFDPTRKFLINATDKYLFQKKEDFKMILNRLSQNIITILDIEKVGNTILQTLSETLRVETGAILLKDEVGDFYRILDAFGSQDRSQKWAKEDPFIRHLEEKADLVNLEAGEKGSRAGGGGTGRPHEIMETLARLGAVIAVPLRIPGEMIGVLCLGKKKSDQEFAADELDYFPTVASQCAIALSNARLYDILKKSQIDFAQQAKMAAIGTLSAGISHEIKNPLNHIKVGIGMLRMNKKHGVLDQMDRPALEEEIFKTLEILDENVTRANTVIERLSSFAKKPKELKIEPVDLEQAVDMALSFVKEDYNRYSIEVEKKFPVGFPKVRADLHTLEDVFLNLLVNARHAMENHGKIWVTGAVTNGELEVAIRDTGKGIAQENLEKIWDPFFTTKDVSRNPDQNAIKGSGLGLFIVREFIQRFGGRITVDSAPGSGTTFRIFFPDSVWIKS